jgi:hypothetical protein
MVDYPDVRRLWWLSEAVHNLSYFAPEVKAATDALGCKGIWMGYFGLRAAPLGVVTPEVVTATFISFSPAMVRRAVPDVWAVATPEQFLALRLQVIDRIYRRIWGDDVADQPVFVEAAALAGKLRTDVETIGRPLAAANLGLPLSGKAHLDLWQSLTIAREHRGDGHIALLASNEINSIQALILACGYGKYQRSVMQPSRKWSDTEWETGAGLLVERGLLHPDESLTELGRDFRAGIETETDRLAAGPYRSLGTDGTRRLTELLVPMARKAIAEPDYPVMPAVGMPDPFGDQSF